MKEHRGSQEGPFLGVDYGLKRVGLAISDPAGKVAVGAGILADLSGRALVRAVRAQAVRRGARAVVLGSPGLHKNGHAATKADLLAQGLEKLGLTVYRWNEDYTTAHVLSERKRVGGKGKPAKRWVDEAAAVLILQDFLDFRRAGQMCKNKP